MTRALRQPSTLEPMELAPHQNCKARRGNAVQCIRRRSPLSPGLFLPSCLTRKTFSYAFSLCAHAIPMPIAERPPPTGSAASWWATFESPAESILKHWVAVLQGSCGLQRAAGSHCALNTCSSHVLAPRFRPVRSMGLWVRSPSTRKMPLCNRCRPWARCRAASLAL